MKTSYILHHEHNKSLRKILILDNFHIQPLSLTRNKIHTYYFFSIYIEHRLNENNYTTYQYLGREDDEQHWLGAQTKSGHCGHHLSTQVVIQGYYSLKQLPPIILRFQLLVLKHRRSIYYQH